MHRFGILRILLGILAFLAIGITSGSSMQAAGPLSDSQFHRFSGAEPEQEHNPTGACSWQVVPSPRVAGFHDIAVVASNDIWAVGHDNTTQPSQTLIEHWDGSSWSVIPSPNVGNENNILLSVAALATNDVWAVGWYNNTVASWRTLIEHWNGNVWSIIPSPTIGTWSNELTGVAMSAPNDVWAVGYFASTAGGIYQTLIVHWDGSTWSVVPSPNLPTDDSYLLGVTVHASNDAWIVGYAEDAGNINRQTLVGHWDGSAWSIIPSPSPGMFESILYKVTALTSNDVWAVGSYANTTSDGYTLTLHWNGSIWSVVPSPNTGSGRNYLFGATAVASNNVWAVGVQPATNTPLIIHWDGGAWSVIPSADPGAVVTRLESIGAVTSTDIWAVGSFSSSGSGGTLVEHYTGPCVTPTLTTTSTNSPTSSPTPTRTGTVSPTSTRTITLSPTRTATPTITRTPTTTPTPDCNPPPGIPPTPRLETRPTGRHSFLTTVDSFLWFNLIQDDDFAAWMQAALASGSGSGVRDATFLFQECYGGGMLDALQNNLSASVRWAGGSASKWNLEAKAIDPPEQPVGGTWTHALLTPITRDQPVLAAIATAAATDPYRDEEIGQWTSANAGHTFGIADPCAANHYAILLSGWMERGEMSFYQSISDIRQTLLAEWQTGNTSIIILFGDGQHDNNGNLLPTDWHARRASRSDLQAAINEVAHSITPNDQFVFYGMGHGGLAEDWFIGGAGSLDGSDAQQSASFNLLPEDLSAMADESVNGETVHMVFSGTLDSNMSVAVSLNGTSLGYLQVGINSADFNVPKSLLGQNNQVILQSINSSPITISSGQFLSGPIGGQEHGIGTVTITPTPTATPCPIQFGDVPTGSTFYSYIRTLACRGIVGGYPCGGPGEPCPGTYYRPNNNVTRGQVSKIVAEAAGFNDVVPSTQQTFEDVPSGATFWLWIERLAGRGYISGYPCGTNPFEPCVAPTNRPYFRANNNVTRGQLSKIVANAAGYAEVMSGQLFEDVPSSSTFYPFITRLALHGVINGYPCGAAPAGGCITPGNQPYFAPGSNVTRGQMAKIGANTFYPGAQTP